LLHGVEKMIEQVPTRTRPTPAEPVDEDAAPSGAPSQASVNAEARTLAADAASPIAAPASSAPPQGAKGSSAPPSEELAKNTVIDDRYLVAERIGRGGMGVVYRARDLGLDRDVAIKVIAQSALSALGDSDQTSGARFVQQFRREAAALAAIRSNHVVPVYAFGRHEDSFFFAMEYVAGNNLDEILQDCIDNGELLPTERVVTILRQVASGLSAIHAAGLVHRDIKPSNVLIERETGRALLIDMGIASKRERNAPTSNNAIGTPQYMSPEQVTREHPITARSDVYALACTAFDMLAARPPFVTDDPIVAAFKQVHEAAPPISRFRSELGPLDPVFERALAKYPDDRFADAQELVDAIERALVPTRPSPHVAMHEPVRAVPSSQRGGPVRVMIVDRDAVFREFCRSAAQLAFVGRSVRLSIADSAEEALALATKRHPNLVLLDDDSTALESVELVRRLRALPNGDRIRVVLVSAPVSDPDRWQLSSLGVEDVLDKSLDLRGLQSAIRDVATRCGWIVPKPSTPRHG
jgi:CheY-like chemotaxis protein